MDANRIGHRAAYMTVVWSAGAPKLILKVISAQLYSHTGLSPGLVRFIGVAEVLWAYRRAVLAAAGYRRRSRLRRSADRSRRLPRPRWRLRRPEGTNTCDDTNRARLGIRRRRRHTRADHVTELTVTPSPVPMALGASRRAASAVIQQLPAAGLVRAQQQHKSGAAFEDTVTNQPRTECPSIRPRSTLGQCAAPPR